MYLKSCTAKGVLYPCLKCTYYCDPIGCKTFRDEDQAIISYPEVYDSIVSLILEDFFGEFIGT